MISSLLIAIDTVIRIEKYTLRDGGYTVCDQLGKNKYGDYFIGDTLKECGDLVTLLSNRTVIAYCITLLINIFLIIENAKFADSGLINDKIIELKKSLDAPPPPTGVSSTGASLAEKVDTSQVAINHDAT